MPNFSPGQAVTVTVGAVSVAVPLPGGGSDLIVRHVAGAAVRYRIGRAAGIVALVPADGAASDSIPLRGGDAFTIAVPAPGFIALVAEGGGAAVVDLIGGTGS